LLVPWFDSQSTTFVVLPPRSKIFFVTLGFDWIVELLPVVLPVLIDFTGDADRLVSDGSNGIPVPRDMIDNSS
jgi:hypothetical protein